MKILLGDFNAKVGREDILKPTIGIKVYMKLVMIRVSGLVNFATSKSLRVKSTMFPHRKSIHILGRLQIGKPTIRLTIF
jgi:hypothetical protein